MIYFGVDILDGVIVKDTELDLTIALEEQWWVLSQDLFIIKYTIDGNEYEIDVGYYPTCEVTEDSLFAFCVIQMFDPEKDPYIYYTSTKNLESFSENLAKCVEFLVKVKENNINIV